MNVLELTKSLLKIKTLAVNGEYECANYLGKILERNGFQVEYFDFAKNRTSLIARYKSGSNRAPFVFTGHIDVVPLGEAAWAKDPFAAETDGDKLYGRGSTDMKGGIAAMVVAAIEFCQLKPQENITLVITAGEETGCEGAKYLAEQTGVLGQAEIVIVGEPTNNKPFLGHRGALWLEMIAHGVTAHGSMPEEGVNAIYKLSRIIELLQQFDFPHEPPNEMGKATLNVSEIQGGLNINSVPDFAKMCVDFRTLPGETHQELLAQIQELSGDDITINSLIDLEAVHSEREHPLVNQVFDICEAALQTDISNEYAPFFTDASVLQQGYIDTPILILGPGITEMAHKTNEYILQSRLQQGVEIYKNILAAWANK